MQADDELCLCFHISCRKVLNYIRIHQVRIPSQLAQCGGAGTGCGWCRKQIEKLMILSIQNPPSAERIDQWLVENTPDRRKYAEARQRYRLSKDRPDSSKDSLERPPPNPIASPDPLDFSDNPESSR
jgi:bacterioferritin-associated ferredoxin